MEDKERCTICSSKIRKGMNVCPVCGNILVKNDYHMNSDKHYNYDIDKNLEYLEKMDDALFHLEQELDAILCKKR